MVSELTKLLGETTWFQKSRHDRITSMDNKGRIGQLKRKPDTNSTTTPKSVHFVDQTPEMEMAAGLRELFPRLEPTVGFFVTLQGLFPLTTLWNGEAFVKPGDYTTCY